MGICDEKKTHGVLRFENVMGPGFHASASILGSVNIYWLGLDKL